MTSIRRIILWWWRCAEIVLYAMCTERCVGLFVVWRRSGGATEVWGGRDAHAEATNLQIIYEIIWIEYIFLSIPLRRKVGSVSFNISLSSHLMRVNISQYIELTYRIYANIDYFRLAKMNICERGIFFID